MSIMRTRLTAAATRRNQVGPGPIEKTGGSTAERGEPRVSLQDNVGAAEPDQLRLLGQFLLTDGTRPVPLPATAERVVAFLALQGPSPRQYVAGSLWPEVPERQAMASLRTAIWRTDRACPRLLEADGRGLRLRAHLLVDSATLAGQIALLLRAPENPSPEADLGGSAGSATLLPGWYDDWVIVPRERLRQMYLEALEITAYRQLARGWHARALESALIAAGLEPLRETAHRALVQIHLSVGNVSEAVRVFDSFRERLDREMSVAPTPAMRGLLSAVMA